MPDIFLSYNREDQATAQRFARAFEAQGFSVWWDVTLRSGEAYDEVTEEALKTAKAVVVRKLTLTRFGQYIGAAAKREVDAFGTPIRKERQVVVFPRCGTGNKSGGALQASLEGERVLQ